MKPKLFWFNLTYKEKYERAKRFNLFVLIAILLVFWKFELSKAILVSLILIASSFGELYYIKKKVDQNKGEIIENLPLKLGVASIVSICVLIWILLVM